MKTTNAVVREALAHHLDRDPSTLYAWQHLELDLHLSPGDLLHIVREVADLEDIELPTDDVTSIGTVGDLLAFVSRVVTRQKGGVHRWSAQALPPPW